MNGVFTFLCLSKITPWLLVFFSDLQNRRSAHNTLKDLCNWTDLSDLSLRLSFFERLYSVIEKWIKSWKLAPCDQRSRFIGNHFSFFFQISFSAVAVAEAWCLIVHLYVFILFSDFFSHSDKTKAHMYFIHLGWLYWMFFFSFQKISTLIINSCILFHRFFYTFLRLCVSFSTVFHKILFRLK